MATWITHLRLAELLVERGLKVDVDMLLAGSVSPDAGTPNADATRYEPPKRVTHWHRTTGEIDPEAYFQRYLSPSELSGAPRAFHVGCYLHLLADALWDRVIWRPKKQTPLYRKALADMQNGVHEIKRDWYGQDFLYLRDHAESLYYTRFRYLDTVPDYLEYFPAGALTANIKRIQTYYRMPTFDLQRPYIYLSQAEIDAYVELAEVELARVCVQKGWLTKA